MCRGRELREEEYVCVVGVCVVGVGVVGIGIEELGTEEEQVFGEQKSLAWENLFRSNVQKVLWEEIRYIGVKLGAMGRGWRIERGRGRICVWWVEVGVW